MQLLNRQGNWLVVVGKQFLTLDITSEKTKPNIIVFMEHNMKKIPNGQV